MAAGVTYFAFLGLFPVLLLAASIIGLVLSGNELLQEELFLAIRETFPGTIGDTLVRQLQDAIDSAGYIGLIALIGFLYAGLRTMDKLRIGMERIWKGHVDGPDVLRDNLQDLVALVVLGAVGLASLGLTGVVTQATSWVLDVLGPDGRAGLRDAHPGARHRAGRRRRHRRLPLAAARGAVGVAPAAAPAAGGAVRRGRASRCSS